MGKSVGVKEYRLAEDRSGESCSIKIGRKGTLTYYDEAKRERRAIRHCPNQKSIFIEEQDKYAKVEAIVFVNGYLTVSDKNPITQEFLDSHPSNVANGGSWFEEVDDEKEAKESIELDELKVDLKSLIRTKSKEKDGIHLLKAEASVVLGSVDEAASKGIEELKQILYNEVDYDPFYFTDDSGNPTIFDNEEVIRKYMVLKAIKDGVVRKSANNKSVLWGKGKDIITTAPMGVDIVDHFTAFLGTDEGMLVMEEITRRS